MNPYLVYKDFSKSFGGKGGIKPLCLKAFKTGVPSHANFRNIKREGLLKKSQNRLLDFDKSSLPPFMNYAKLFNKV